jgi:hypothetical protein
MLHAAFAFKAHFLENYSLLTIKKFIFYSPPFAALHFATKDSISKFKFEDFPLSFICLL